MFAPLAGLRREQQAMLLVVGAAVVAVGIYALAVGGPLMRALRAQREGVLEAKAQLERMEQTVTQETGLRKRLDDLQQSMRALHEAMPAEETLPVVIERLSEMATRSGLKIQTIFPQRAIEDRPRPEDSKTKKAEGAELYKEIPIQVDALAGFHQLGQFISSIEHHSQPIRLKNLRITSNLKELRRHNVKMVLVAYFASSKAKQVDGLLPEGGVASP